MMLTKHMKTPLIFLGLFRRNTYSGVAVIRTHEDNLDIRLIRTPKQLIIRTLFKKFLLYNWGTYSILYRL